MNAILHARLGDVCDIQIGRTPPRAEPRYWGVGYPWLSIADMSQGKDIVTTKESITDAAVSSRNCQLIPAGTVVFSFKLSVGKVGILRKDMFTNEAIAALSVRDERRLDSAYLYHALRALDLRGIGEQAVKGITLNSQSLASLAVPLPSIGVQRRVVAVLDKADAIRRRRVESVQLMDQLLRSSFLEAFGDPVSNSLEWPAKQLGEIALVRRGASPRPIEEHLGGTVPWIKIGDATGATGLYIDRTDEHVTEAGAARSVRLMPGSVVIANSGVSLGFARILRISGCIHDGWLSIEQLSDNVHPLYFVSLVNLMTRRLRTIAPSGTQPNLNIGIARALRIPIPPLAKQERFAELVVSADAARSRSMQAELLSVRLCDSLAQQLLGKRRAAELRTPAHVDTLQA
jgi:restriction endonuclease S subunit